MKKFLFAAAAVGAVAFSAWALPRRVAWEGDRPVELCADGTELLALTAGDPQRLAAALDGLAAAGLSSVGVLWDTAAPIDDALKPWAALPAGVTLVLRPAPAPFTTPVATAPASVSALLFAGEYAWGYPDMGPAKAWVETTGWTLPWMEFGRQLGAAALLRAFPGRVVRGHSMDEEEMARATPPQVRTRFLRAVKERGIRFLYLRFFPGLSVEANLAHARGLAAALKKAGFGFDQAPARYAPGRFIPLRQALAFLAACLLPVLFLQTVLAWRAGPAQSVAAMSTLTLGAALFVAALLSAPDFYLGFEKFRGVKAALVVPLLAAFLQLYTPEELQALLKKPLTVGLAAAGGALALILVFYVLRSGHESGLGVSGAELKLREALETFFGVRPRFKEFAVGHPFLWLGFYLWKDQGAPRSFDARPWLLLGLVGQLSMINTFCHAHMPLTLSLLRTAHGLWLGALGGFALILLARGLRHLRAHA